MAALTEAHVLNALYGVDDLGLIAISQVPAAATGVAAHNSLGSVTACTPAEHAALFPPAPVGLYTPLPIASQSGVAITKEERRFQQLLAWAKAQKAEQARRIKPA